MTFYCYLLFTNNKHTYIGATIDIDHRLRQHNGELVGGAKYTKIQLNKGLTWNRICYLTNIPEWRSALQIEWKWKQLGRTTYKHIRDPIYRRLYSLKKLLSLEKPTNISIPYDAYPSGPPQIIWEVDEYKQYYDSLQIDT
jgi:predicted GIY-YIG superfamily endonuclease